MLRTVSAVPDQPTEPVRAQATTVAPPALRLRAASIGEMSPRQRRRKSCPADPGSRPDRYAVRSLEITGTGSRRRPPASGGALAQRAGPLQAQKPDPSAARGLRRHDRPALPNGRHWLGPCSGDPNRSGRPCTSGKGRLPEPFTRPVRPSTRTSSCRSGSRTAAWPVHAARPAERHGAGQGGRAERFAAAAGPAADPRTAWAECGADGPTAEVRTRCRSEGVPFMTTRPNGDWLPVYPAASRCS